MTDTSYKNLTKPEVIALDLDETVHNVILFYERAVNETRVNFDYPTLSSQEFQSIYSNGYITAEDVFQIMFGNKKSQALKFYYDALHSYELSEDYMLPGAKEIITHVKKLGLTLIAVTNATQHVSKKILRDMGVFKYFDAITGVKDTRILKPDPMLMTICLQKINYPASKKVWFIGDSSTDTECAKRSNCTAIRYYFNKEKPIDPNADALFDCHYKIIETLDYFYGADYKARHNHISYLKHSSLDF